MFLADESGAEPIVLGDDSARAYISPAPLPSAEAVIEGNPLPGAETLAHLARGNVNTSLNFGVQENHFELGLTGAEARGLAVLHVIDRVAAVVGKVGRLTIMEGDDYERQLTDAVCRAARPQLIEGVETLITYDFVGGRFANPN